LFRNKRTRYELCNFLTGFTIILLTLTLLNISSAEASIRKNIRYSKTNHKFAEIVIDAASGKVLSQQHADKQLYPASLTKMMTLYLTFEAMSEGRLYRSQKLPVSYHAASQVPSSLRLKHGNKISVGNAVLSIVTKSANDSAVVLAEALGKTERNFARKMTAKARELGMSRTHFANASGLYNRRNLSTARDMARLARALIQNYPDYYHYFNTGSFTYKGKTYKNHNKLMKTYEGMDGLKTGYIYASGFNVVTSAVRNGTRIIGVVFGGKTTRSRNRAMARYLDRGFSRVNGMRIASLNKNIAVPFPIRRPDIYNNEDSDDNNYSFTDNIVAQINRKTLIAQGDSSLTEDEININNILIAPKKIWGIQVGSFANPIDSLKAIISAKENSDEVRTAQYNISPLATKRGTIYRARLSGLNLSNARNACDRLQNGCLILSRR